MSRDVLLALLVLALLLNLAFLSQVGAMRARRERTWARDREEARRREAARRAEVSRAVAAQLPSGGPGGAARTFFVPARDGNGSGRVALPDRSPATNDHAIAALPATTAIAEPPPPLAENAPRADEPHVAAAASLDAASVTTSSDAGPRKTRGRRFVLPKLDEDQDRTSEAIEAFLDGPPPEPGTTTERPQRRRHRVRRPAGTPVPRTTMLVWLQGFADLDRAVGTSRANHVSNAFRDALRRSARSSDEVRDAGPGRMRLIIDADDAGANAYVERARASVQPWLELLSIPLRVECGAHQSTEIIPFAGTRRAVVDR
jgi:hypothetical protein